MHPEIARARRALDEGRTAEARAVLDALDAGSLGRADLVERALALSRACLESSPRDVNGALTAIEQGLQLASSDPRLNVARAVALTEAGRLDEAEKSISKAVALAPDDADAHVKRGTIRERRGAHEKALRSFTRALAIDPDQLAAYARRAAVERRLGRFEEARADLERYLDEVPLDAAEWVALGIVRSELGAHDDALKAFKQALEIDPDDLMARFQAVVAVGKKRDLSLMASLVDELAKAGGPDRRVEWARGLLASERGALAEAAELLARTYRRALIENDAPPELDASAVAERLFPVMRKLGKIAEARGLFEEALRKGHHRTRLLRLYARSFGRPAARGLRLRLLVRSRGSGDPPERLARAFEVEAETLDEAWDLAFEVERTLGGQGLERGPILEEQKIPKEDGPLFAAILAIGSRVADEEPSEPESPEPQGFEPEKGWSPEDEGQSGGDESAGDEGS